MKKHIFRWTLLLAIGLSIGFYIKAQSELGEGVTPISPDDNKVATILKKPTSTKNNGVVGGDIIGGDFTLIDHNGQEVTQETYADAYKLIFFGFTFCPAVCPTELQKITVIMDELDETSKNITPLFITVDPERDTVETMKDYVTQFHPGLIGLTGSPEQIEVVKQAFRVFASKVKNDMMDEYMMDHSSFLYFMNKDNELIAMYPSKDTASQIAEDIKKKIF